MIKSPFTLFEPFQEKLSIGYFSKADNLRSDEGSKVANALGAKQFVALHAVHGNRTVTVREPSDCTIQADGMITDQSGLCLTIRAADCQNFVIYAPEKGVVGVLHAGWHGMTKRALTHFYEELNRSFKITPKETLVGAGPSLCQTCADFTNPLEELPEIDPKHFDGRCVDLQGIANEELTSLGVPASNIERSPECTRCNPETLWTYRGGDREAVVDGYTNVLCGMLK